jgi:RNA polymerase sigma-B factor
VLSPLNLVVVSPSNGGVGEIGANAHLIDSHLPLVRAVARRYAGRGAELDDLVQVGSLGLVKASDRFDPGRGVAFATFAKPAIEGEIRRHLRDRERSVRVPRDLQKTSRTVRRQRAELAASLGRFPTTAELAEALSVDEAEIERAVAAGLAREHVAVPPDHDALDQSAGPEQLDGSDDRLLLAAAMRVLSERERRLVFLRFHADMTERQIAQTVGISQAHVSRLLDGALTKLRVEMAADKSHEGHDDRRDTTPNRVVSNVSGTKLGDVGAPRKTTPVKQAKPRQPSSHSGKFLVRMPSELHEQLARAAEREDVSLNRFVTDVLAASVEGSTLRSHSGSADGGSADGDGSGSREDDGAPASKRLSPSAVRVALATNLVVVIMAGLVAVILLVLALQRGI